MRKLLNTLFVLTEDAYLRLDGENVVVEQNGEELGRFPLHTLEGIQSFSYRGASPNLMAACVRHTPPIDLCFFSPRGVFEARICGESRGNVLLRKAQYAASDDPIASFRLGRSFLLGKVYNGRWVLERTLRDHALRVDSAALSAASAQMQQGLTLLAECHSLEELRGQEGALAERYFSVFDELILNNKEEFRFAGRNRRPPLDRINALLSFCYSLLANQCAHALEGAGLDPYVGFLHRDRPGRKSLALDLMEELRSVSADRFALTCINQKTVQPQHFDRQESGAVWLNDAGRRAVLTAWRSRQVETITHPFLKEKLPWGMVPSVQALLLARTLRGDLDEYPPFFWK